jgi:hypothetical protein
MDKPRRNTNTSVTALVLVAYGYGWSVRVLAGGPCTVSYITPEFFSFFSL